MALPAVIIADYGSRRISKARAGMYALQYTGFAQYARGAHVDQLRQDHWQKARLGYHHPLRMPYLIYLNHVVECFSSRSRMRNHR